MLVSTSPMALYSASVTVEAAPSTPGSAFSVVGTGVELCARADAMAAGVWRRCAGLRMCASYRVPTVLTLERRDTGAGTQVATETWPELGRGASFRRWSPPLLPEHSPTRATSVSDRNGDGHFIARNTLFTIQSNLAPSLSTRFHSRLPLHETATAHLTTLPPPAPPQLKP
jgi:hypothetical protein